MASPADLPLRAARLLALKRWPYLGPALWRLDIRPGHPKTMGVDANFRLYFCADWVAAQTQPALASVLAHEVWHVLRRHFERRGDRHPAAWNIAVDAEINDTLPDLPQGCVTPESIGQERHLLAEQYFAALQQQQQQNQGRPEQGNEGAGESQGGADTDPSAAAAQADTEGQSPGSGSADDADGSPDSSAGSGAGDPSPQSTDEGASDGGGEGQDPSSPSQASGRLGSSSPADPQDADATSQGLPSPDQYGGSCADGVRREWEQDCPSLSPAQRRMIERAVAREVQTCGSHPGDGVRNWAEAALRERPLPWQQILAGEIRHAVAWASGHGDFTWMRPSRRGAGREYIPPAIRRPIPEVAVVIDSSGSMDDVRLASARREVEALLRALGAPAHIVSCDTMAHSVGRATTLRGMVLEGDGGTDMREGIQYAQSLRPRPRVIITLTDGFTPWPVFPPAGARHVCVLVGGGEGPKWGKSVRVGREAS